MHNLRLLDVRTNKNVISIKQWKLHTGIFLITCMSRHRGTAGYHEKLTYN